MPDKEAPLKYPIFLKACHITQGIQHGTHFIKSQADFAEHFHEHMVWVRNIYTTVSSDNERPWAKEALILYPMVRGVPSWASPSCGLPGRLIAVAAWSDNAREDHPFSF
jgi:hypothetical protein